MNDVVDLYLADHETAWAPSTQKSEKSRLNIVRDRLNGSPSDLHLFLVQQGHKPYSIKTLFVRVCAMEAWALKKKLTKEDSFSEYMRKHSNKFKHVYKKEEIEVSYEEACRRINTLLDDPFRSMALSLLQTGVRLSEAYQVVNGEVKGKGGKNRKVYGTISKTAPKSSFARKLKAIGLKPHSLRKLCATRLVEKGATPADLCKVFGWSSIATAYQYLQAKEDSKLGALVEEAAKGPHSADT